MLKKYWYLFLVLLIEGAVLMSVELMGAKLLAPFYGSLPLCLDSGVGHYSTRFDFRVSVWRKPIREMGC